MSVYGMAIDSILMCFLYDEELAKGRAIKIPKHCPELLQEFFDSNEKKWNILNIILGFTFIYDNNNILYCSSFYFYYHLIFYFYWNQLKASLKCIHLNDLNLYIWWFNMIYKSCKNE